MSSSQRTVDFILDQIEGAGSVAARRMFGEYGLYCDGRLVALVCDDRLFVKPTGAGRGFLGEVELARPYPQAKPWYLIAEEKWDEREWLARLVAITTAQLPLPLPLPVPGSPRKRKETKK
ncbi:MAG: TfoX/Sxy family protein [Rudaea sp.]|uniref:TfoX/Sxy family protein n=1 Tax=Rudaea sp. TaxID=2136325 RepID=UPI0039E2D370